MLEMTKVRFGYGRRRAPLFEALDFSVQPGGIVGLLGKNGAGKTTLLKLGAGLLFPHNGESLLFGAEASLRAPEMLARIAYVPSSFDVPSIRFAPVCLDPRGVLPALRRRADGALPAAV
jgi:ABC-2 type transport system ATP-binding protein